MISRRRYSFRAIALAYQIFLNFVAEASQPVDNDGAQEGPPNILVLFADNLGYNDIGVYGAPTAKTPNIDRLVQDTTGNSGSTRDSVKFTHWNSAAHLCSASRASLLTGQYPVRLGVYPGVFHPDAGSGLPPPTGSSNHTTIAAALKDRGYATSIVGKWHLGHLPQYLPLHYGFDEWLGIPYHMSGGSVDNHSCVDDVDGSMWLPLYQGETIVQQPVNLQELAPRYATQATNFIQKYSTKQKPWFLYMSFSHVHNLCAPSDFPEQETCQWNTRQGAGARFVDAVEEMDWIAGQILDTLDELGIQNDTLVLFTSDNGPWVAEQICSGSKGPFEGRWLQDNTPMNCTACPHNYVPVHPTSSEDEEEEFPLHTCRLPGTTRTLQGVPCGHDTGLGGLWEANLRMPALLRWPNHIHASSPVLSLPVSTLDVLPTILSIVDGATKSEAWGDVRPQEQHIMDGIDLLPLLSSPTTTKMNEVQNRPLFFWRDGFQDGPLPQPYGRVDVAAMKLGRIKLWFWTKSAHYNEDKEQFHDPPLLFDVLDDPGEAFPLNASLYSREIQHAKSLIRQHKAQIEIGQPLTLVRDAKNVPCVDRKTKCRTTPLQSKPENGGAVKSSTQL